VWGRCISEFQGYPGWKLPQILADAGFEIVSLKSRTADYFLALEHSSSQLSKISRWIPVARRFLVSLEPRSVTPNQYSPRTRGKYGRVFVQSPLQVYGGRNVDVIPAGLLPSREIIQKDLVESSNARRQKGSIGIVNQNKFSFVAGSRYKLRRALVIKLAEMGVPVNLAGSNWNKSIVWHLIVQAKSALWLFFIEGYFPRAGNFQLPLPHIANLHLHGRVNSELEFMRRFEFALVVENDPDYVSEKLFNAIRAGAVPIYVGPPLDLFGIPNSVAIQAPASAVSIAETFADSCSKQQIDSCRVAGSVWLSDTETIETWNHDNGFTNIASRLYELAQLERENGPEPL
jgi:hypothetical protein